MSINGRALHFVLKIGDRAKNAFFFRTILGMKVLRHEEFKEGCDAQCNGPYENRWSKTMIGYGPESSHFVMELTYNYGVKSYELGNTFGGVTIKSNEILKRARSNNYPITQENNASVVRSPDGYEFHIIEAPEPNNSDQVMEVTLHSSNLAASKKYWHELLAMKVLLEESRSIMLSYGENQTKIRMLEISDPLNPGKSYGRTAFAVPGTLLSSIQEIISKAEGKILTPLITLDTPGKATVSVVILADPDGHEICFVDEEGFSLLSKVEEEGENMLDKYIAKDPFQEK